MTMAAGTTPKPDLIPANEARTVWADVIRSAREGNRATYLTSQGRICAVVVPYALAQGLTAGRQVYAYTSTQTRANLAEAMEYARLGGVVAITHQTSRTAEPQRVAALIPLSEAASLVGPPPSDPTRTV